MTETITGSEIIADICSRIVNELGKSCHLRETDSYGGYSAKVTVEIQLRDIDPVTVEASLTIGNHNSATPSRRIVVEIPAVSPTTARERSGTLPPSLERMIDGSELAPVKRYYAPRQKKSAA